MSETPAAPFDPELTPHLIARADSLPRNLDLRLSYDPAPWGAWSGGDRPRLAKGDWGVASVWESDSTGGNWTAVTEFRDGIGGLHVPRNNGGDRMYWGAWAELDGRPVLAGGGISGIDDDGAIWLWSPDDKVRTSFETGSISGSIWGVWGQLDGDVVLVTGDFGGWVRLWDPRTRAERGAFQVTTDDIEVFWGAWGQQDGQPVLATGGDVATQLWPVSVLRDPAAASSMREMPRLLRSEGTLWGAWGQVGGVDLLATGTAAGGVRMTDSPARPGTILLHDNSTDPTAPRRSRQGSTWGFWAEANGHPVVIAGERDGLVHFCDPATQKRHEVRLGRNVRWGSWGRLDGKPVLTVGDDQGEVWIYDLVWERAVPRVPRYKSDTGSAVDLLGRRNDAEALADVITARSARPPLAVGVFGQWGDGKSMFLEMVQEQVRDRALAAGRDDPIAHGLVRQVRFNAWHYAEADLWASLVAELFGQLNSEDPAADPGREQRQRSRLASELVQARGRREQLAAAEERLADLQQARLSAEWASLPDVAQRDLQLVLGDDAAKVYQEYGTNWSTLRATWFSLRFLGRTIPRGVWLLCAGAALVFAALLIWGPGVVRWLAALPPLAVIALATRTVKEGWEQTGPARNAITAGWRAVQRVREEQNRRLETAEAVAAAEVAELRSRLQNLTSAGQLAGVVQERVGAASYRERLGLMTEIRQDFERMAELLRPDETRQTDIPVTDAAGDELPAIDRIVVYIDDLDRCPPDRVVEVLEAVHLLLAVKLFVVVVAVDPRWLLRSLTSHYQELFATTGPVTDEDEMWASTPAQYLEKIFQIVLTLPPMDQAGYRQMVDDLVGLQMPTATDRPMPTAAAAPVADSNPRAATFGGSASLTQVQPLDLTARIVDRVDPLALTAEELELINLLGPPLITGPRSVKRLANSYGLLIATSTTNSFTSEHRADLVPVPDLAGSTPPYRAGMVLLAAVIGFPMLGPAFFPDLHHTALRKPGTSWSDHLRDLRPTEGASGNRPEPTLTATRRQQWNAFLDALETIGERAAAAGQPLPQDVAIWAKWVVPVGRLSFPTGSAVSRLS